MFFHNPLRMGTVSKTAREERFSGTIQRHQYSRYCNFKLICNVLFVYAYISPKKRNTEHYVVKQERALLKSRIFREEIAQSTRMMKRSHLVQVSLYFTKRSRRIKLKNAENFKIESAHVLSIKYTLLPSN